MIAIASFNNSGEAELFQSHLKSIGIESDLEEDPSPPQPAAALFRVSITERDLPGIQHFINRDILQLVAESSDHTSCPSCGSINTGLRAGARRSSFFGSIFGKKSNENQWDCLDCERRFRLMAS